MASTELLGFMFAGRRLCNVLSSLQLLLLVLAVTL